MGVLFSFIFISYTEQHSASLFHTESVSYFHDTFLFLVMANYVFALDDGDDVAVEEILISDMPFHFTAHKYIQVFTK